MALLRMWPGRLLVYALVIGSMALPAADLLVNPSRADEVGFIAYTTDRVADQFELFRIRADGTENRRLTLHLFTDEIDPDWSPDGAKIAFVSNRFGSADIFIMNSDGSDQQRLIVNAFRREVDPDWSPDGMEIAFAWDLQGGQFDIWVADLRTGIARRVTNDFSGDERYPNWSPDGRRLAYTCEHAGQNEICIVDLHTLDVQRLTRRVFTDDWQPAWSPDGAQILFTSIETTDQSQISHHAPRGTMKHEDGAGSVGDRPERYFQIGRPARPVPDLSLSDVATATATATATTVIATPSETASPTLTPSATPVPIEGSAIWIMEADGSNPRKLIDLAHRAYDPTWSPGGTRIAFTRQRIDSQSHQLEPPGIYIYDLLTGQAWPLGPLQAPVRGQAPDWIGAITLAPTPTPTQELPPPPPATASPTSTLVLPPPPPPPPATPSPTATFDLPPPPPPGATSTPTEPLPPPSTNTPTPTKTVTPIVTATAPPPPSGTPCQLIQNSGFETGPPADPWTTNRHGGTGTLVRREASRTGQWGLRLGTENSAWDEARQVVSLVCPELGERGRQSRIFVEFSFWTRVMGDGPATNGDVLNVVLLTPDGRQLLRLLKTLTDHDADRQWHHTTIRFSDYVGETIQVAIGATIDEEGPTTFDIDDVELVLVAERTPYQRYLPLITRPLRIQ